MSQNSMSTFRYNRLTVRDAKVEDMIMLGERAMFRPTKLLVESDHRIYEVEYAIVDKVTCFKSSKQYFNHEFSYEIFGFKECRDFVKGKVVRVNPEKSSIKM